MKHREFAEIYYIFMKHVDYDNWYKFLKNYIKKDGKVLDLGCGTGEFIFRMLKDGHNMIGVDISKKMLEIAGKKLEQKRCDEKKYKLIEENIINYKHNEKVDYIICIQLII